MPATLDGAPLRRPLNPVRIFQGIVMATSTDTPTPSAAPEPSRKRKAWLLGLLLLLVLAGIGTWAWTAWSAAGMKAPTTPTSTATWWRSPLDHRHCDQLGADDGDLVHAARCCCSSTRPTARWPHRRPKPTWHRAPGARHCSNVDSRRPSWRPARPNCARQQDFNRRKVLADSVPSLPRSCPTPAMT